MITCEQCGSAEQVVITQHSSRERSHWHALCEGCGHGWDFDD